MMNQKCKKIVVVGGGTGTVAVLSGLKKYQDLDLSVIVSMTDDGGSNAVVRDEFGLLPLSDVRKSIIALADTDNRLLRELFTYRFAKGEGLSGHTLGNLMMMALADVAGSEVAAIARLSELFRVRGRVIPVTLEHTQLVAQYADGHMVTGEHLIDEPATDPGKIIHLSLAPAATAHHEAVRAINEADVIIAGPGDLFTSTLANIIIPGIAEAIQASRARFIFVTNLMTKRGQTQGLTATDTVAEITRYSGRTPDVVVAHDDGFSAAILEKYQAQGDAPIVDDLVEGMYKIVRAEIVNPIEKKREEGDTLVRSLIRHDAEKLGATLYHIISV